jgi:hypothetical protein
MGFLGWLLTMVGTVGFLPARPSAMACQSGVDLVRTIGTANPQQTCTCWQWGWEGSICLVAVGVLLIVWSLDRAAVLGVRRWHRGQR